MLQHSILKDLVAYALRQVNKDPMEAWGPTLPHPRKMRTHVEVTCNQRRKKMRRTNKKNIFSLYYC